MKITNQGIEYNGGWQEGSVILQKLEGPMGNGTVTYPNGDRFEGFFHLSFAHTSGPAYAADGRYDFADGSFIERAWIKTSEDLVHMDLIGVYHIRSAKGPDTLTPFKCHHRCGIEVVLAEKPYAIEWHEGEKIQELGLQSYTFEHLDKDRSVLTIVLSDGTVVKETGGRLEQNKYNNWVFDTCLHTTVSQPDGTTFESYGYNMKHLKPFDGRVSVHETCGRYHNEVWEKGQLKEKGAEKME